MTEVEVYDIEKNQWKVLNYIADQLKLSILHAGAIQVSGQKIMIFGGIVPLIERTKKEGGEETQQQVLDSVDHSHLVTITNNCFYLNVSNGTIKRGSDLMKQSYYICGGS